MQRKSFLLRVCNQSDQERKKEKPGDSMTQHRLFFLIVTLCVSISLGCDFPYLPTTLNSNAFLGFQQQFHVGSQYQTNFTAGTQYTHFTLQQQSRIRVYASYSTATVSIAILDHLSNTLYVSSLRSLFIIHPSFSLDLTDIHLIGTRRKCFGWRIRSRRIFFEMDLYWFVDCSSLFRSLSFFINHLFVLKIKIPHKKISLVHRFTLNGLFLWIPDLVKL